MKERNVELILVMVLAVIAGVASGQHPNPPNPQPNSFSLSVVLADFVASSPLSAAVEHTSGP